MSEGYKMTELGEIPESWEIERLGDCVISFAGGTPLRNKSEYYAGGIIPWVKSGEVNQRNIFRTQEKITVKAIAESSAKIIKPDSVLIALYGATAGNVGMLRVEAASNQAVLAIRSKTKRLNNDYIYHYLKQATQNLLSLTQGSGQPNLSKGIIDNLKISVPSPEEQQKITDILSAVDEKVDVIDAQIIQTQELKKGLMQQLLTKGIGHTEYKDSPLGEIPESWEVVKFEELLANHKNPLSYGILQPGDDIEGGIPMLRTVDLSEVGLAKTKILKVSKAISNSSAKTILQGGEVLLSVMGTLGRTVVVPNAWKGWNVNRALAVIRFNDLVVNTFMCQFFRSTYFKGVIEKQSLGSAQMRINLNGLRKYFIPLPSLKEQQNISNILSTIDEKLDILQEKKQNYQELKKGLMQQLLNGKLRVQTEAYV